MFNKNFDEDDLDVFLWEVETVSKQVFFNFNFQG
jgi:hypothetical protein